MDSQLLIKSSSDRIKIKIVNTDGFSRKELLALDTAVKTLDALLDSDSFKAEVICRKYTEDQGLGGQGVYEKIISGNQLCFDDEDGVIDLKLVMYNKWWSRVVGYSFLNSMTIWINRKFWGSPKYIASNLLHEYCHQLGFTHNGVFKTSVPYQMNEVVEKLWDQVVITK